MTFSAKMNCRRRRVPPSLSRLPLAPSAVVMFSGLARARGLGLGLSFRCSPFAPPLPPECPNVRSLKEDYFRQSHNITSTPPAERKREQVDALALSLRGRQKCISDAATEDEGRKTLENSATKWRPSERAMRRLITLLKAPPFGGAARRGGVAVAVAYLEEHRKNRKKIELWNERTTKGEPRLPHQGSLTHSR